MSIGGIGILQRDQVRHFGVDVDAGRRIEFLLQRADHDVLALLQLRRRRRRIALLAQELLQIAGDRAREAATASNRVRFSANKLNVPDVSCEIDKVRTRGVAGRRRRRRAVDREIRRIVEQRRIDGDASGIGRSFASRLPVIAPV